MVIPINSNSLSTDKIKMLLDLVNLIKLKRDDMIKVWLNQNSSKQYIYLKEDELIEFITVLF